MSYEPTPWERYNPHIEYRFVVDDGNPIFEYIVDGYHNSFTMMNVAEHSREWLKDVLLRQIDDIRAHAFKAGEEHVRQPILDALHLRKVWP